MLSHLEVNNTYYFLVNIVRTLNRVYEHLNFKQRTQYTRKGERNYLGKNDSIETVSYE